MTCWIFTIQEKKKKEKINKSIKYQHDHHSDLIAHAKWFKVIDMMIMKERHYIISRPFQILYSNSTAPINQP